MPKNESFYLTTPIYYVNDIPHLGTAYCTIAADILARYERLRGKDVIFLTGTDEHGEKVQEAAIKAGKTPQVFTDQVAGAFKGTWEKIKISFDDFIRTTEERHKETVTHYLAKAVESGDVYLGEYEGWYCVPDETFWTQGQLVNGKCPTCGRDVKKIKEENYFFKLGKYIPQLVQHIHDHPTFILPETKRNEVLGFLKEEIRDLSISRTSFSWGIPFPKDETKTKQNHVVYVWFDALFNYVSALEPLKNQGAKFGRFWGNKSHPKAIHLIGKDILRFHAVYWPCFLMSVGLPLPKRIFATGWWTVEGQKMSKSLGNAIEPVAFTTQWGLDAFRLFLFREFPMGQDGDFSIKNFKERVNADLANNLGNLVSRTLNLIQKNMDGKVFETPLDHSNDKDIGPLVISNYEMLRYQYLGRSQSDPKLPSELMETFQYHGVLNMIFGVLNGINKYLEIKAPWAMAKDPSKKTDMINVLNSAAETIRVTAIMLWPFIPETSAEILRRLGQGSIDDLINSSNKDDGLALQHALGWGEGKPATVTVGTPLFMRLQ